MEINIEKVMIVNKKSSQKHIEKLEDALKHSGMIQKNMDAEISKLKETIAELENKEKSLPLQNEFQTYIISNQEWISVSRLTKEEQESLQGVFLDDLTGKLYKRALVFKNEVPF